MNTLQDGRPKSFAQIMSDSSFARQTVLDHLRHLAAEGKVIKQEVKHPERRGRPAFSYRIPRALTRAASSTIPVDVVKLNFLKLRHVCRYETGGWCKQARKKCVPENCPIIIKEELNPILSN